MNSGTCRLVLISGAIASGKTTVAFKLAAEARSRGLLAAAIDMDELVETVAGTDWSKVTSRHRKLACELAGAMTARMIEADAKLIVLAGSTVAAYEWDSVLKDLEAPPKTLFVLLKVSLEESIRRAQADPSRVATRDAAVVRRHFERIDWISIRQPDFEVMTDGHDVDQVVALIANRVYTAE